MLVRFKLRAKPACKHLRDSNVTLAFTTPTTAATSATPTITVASTTA
jgi:hypothetical protein